MRASLGATRWRLVRQLLIESLLLAAGGAVLGCLFAYGGVKAVAALIPDGFIPREAVIRLNVPVLLFSLAAGHPDRRCCSAWCPRCRPPGATWSSR